MARPKKSPDALTVVKEATVHDGCGGFLSIGKTFVPADNEAAKALIAKGLAR